jgi:ABC-type branched-subunit amino acid transport system ATPase component
MKLFIAHDELDAGVSPLELQEELAKVCDINSKENFALLLYVLMQHDLQLVEETLDRNCISKDVPGFDGIKGW